MTLPADLAVGDHTYYCSIPGHRESGMEGTLTIVEAGGGAAEAPAEEASSRRPRPPRRLSRSRWRRRIRSSGAATRSPSRRARCSRSPTPGCWSTTSSWTLSLNAPLPLGETVEVTMPDDAPVGDTYEFYCSIPGHRSSGMVGNLTIVEAGVETGATPAEGTPAPVVASPVPADVAALMEDPEVVALEATDPYNWSVKALNAHAGQTIRVLNLGVLEHDFVIDEWDVTQPLAFGEPVDIQVPDDVEVGDTYLYYCSIPGHRARHGRHADDRGRGC